jgi:hypothetical protein
LATAETWGEARRIIDYHRAESRVEEAKKNLAAQKLVRYAGVQGVDWLGRPFDQREFAETKRALGMLAAFHAGQYGAGRYREDLFAQFGHLLASDESPDPQIASDVRRDGKAWFAWRRTVGGWFFGIGATRPPPDTWTYEGEDPPAGYPRLATRWRHDDFALENDDA